MIKFNNLPNRLRDAISTYSSCDYTKLEIYFFALIATVAIALTLSLLFDLFNIHIYRHDALYYIDQETYLEKLKQEGRWLNYFLFPALSVIPGRLAILLEIVSLFIFALIASNRWTKNLGYALLLAFLVIHISPLMPQFMWPAVIFPSFLLLLVAALVSSRMPTYGFYLVFGVLFLGTLSHLYYLLPLAHLTRFSSDASLRQNLRQLFLNLLPAWALGFVAGYGVALLMVYIISGQVGLQIAEWRNPHYIHDIRDLLTNIMTSWRALTMHSESLFSSVLMVLAGVAAIAIGAVNSCKNVYVPMVILALAIIIAQYVIVIPIGIMVSFRTAIATWLGFIALMFFIPAVSKRQYLLLLPLIVVTMVSFNNVNHQTLKWYSFITNTYYEALLRSSPLPPKQYKGLLFLSTDAEVQSMNARLTNHLHLTLEKINMEYLGQANRWAPVAHEAGFKTVLLCNAEQKFMDVCRTALSNFSSAATMDRQYTGLYRILGQQDGFLVVAINSESNV